METVRSGYGNGVRTDEVISVLEEHEFQDLSRQRVTSIVSSTAERRESHREKPKLSQRPSTTGTPEGYDSRHTDREDAEYLSNKEFAFLLMAILSRMDGSTVRPDRLDTEVDLFWRRQHKTIAFRTLARPDGVPIDAAVIQSVIEGETNPQQGRNPSRVVALTNTYFTDEAAERAEDSDVELRDGSHLAEWLDRTRVPIDLLGDLLEYGDNRDFDLESRLEEVSSNEAFLDGFELLELTGYDIDLDVTPTSVSIDGKPQSSRSGADTSTRWVGDDSTTSDDASQPESATVSEAANAPKSGSAEAQSSANTHTRGRRSAATERVVQDYEPSDGLTGKLYADQNEDGDYDAFDKLMDDFEKADES
ncbi:Restriction endonuclease [Halopenitus malekzadehii]|uniref:Restriction endonuclease n=1 Tax=Halopenitus malekzadehii TaxID=1267564 RepID=A0A1H6JW63_9EURY|nr:restriction endonuclease [Halopenitus malekzadehii]SEH66815.1 Restriction endonuclease [Halopenitus malekzadehii]